MAEKQAKWVAAHLAGEFALPDVAEMERMIVEDEERHMSRYYPSARHTMQIDEDIYAWELVRERRRGRKRLSALGLKPGWLPVPARAGLSHGA
jgi:hypothetical protein